MGEPNQSFKVVTIEGDELMILVRHVTKEEGEKFLREKYQCKDVVHMGESFGEWFLSV